MNKPMKLRYNGDPSLSSVAEPVTEDDDVSELIAVMWTIMHDNNGIGLAANQVGVLKRVITVQVGGFRQVFINPVITKAYGGKATDMEGCLSYPMKLVKVVRDRQIIVEALDDNMQPIRRKLKGLLARCVQHEVDHLNGVTIG